MIQAVRSLSRESKEEIELVGLDAMKTLTELVKKHPLVFVGKIDGTVCCIWGVMSSSLLSGEASIWMATTNAIDRSAFIFARYSQRQLQRILETVTVIHCAVSDTHTRSKRWLKWLGFSRQESKSLKGRVIHIYSRRR